MKIHIKHVVLLPVLALLAAGCKKQLNVYPTTQEVSGNIITDANSAAVALNGVYYRFADGGADNNNVPSTEWFWANEEVAAMLSGEFSYPGGSGGGLGDHTYNPTSYYIDYVWTYGYNLVNAANGFLVNIAPVTTVTAAAKSQMVAETKFLRAFANSELLLYYGQYDDTTSPYGIILRNEFVAPDNLYLPRSSVAASYDSIISDLNAAIPDLPNTNTTVASANTWAAKLLKARVLINRGSPADYTSVISITQDIIANSPFQLEANTQDIFWTKGFTSQEVMLGVQPYPTQNARWMEYIYYIDFGPNAFMSQLFSGDPRLAWMIQTVNNPYGPYPALTKYYPGSITNIAATPITEYCYAFRLTEAYLLQAEALVAANGSLADARTLLKTVMAHGGVTDFSSVDSAVTASALQLQIIEEEMRNFVAECGQEWFAVRRLPFTTLQSLLPNVTNKSLLLLPIPEAEVIANSQLKQNPNY